MPVFFDPVVENTLKVATYHALYEVADKRLRSNQLLENAEFGIN
jgi:hypothetical protein